GLRGDRQGQVIASFVVAPGARRRRWTVTSGDMCGSNLALSSWACTESQASYGTDTLNERPAWGSARGQGALRALPWLVDPSAVNAADVMGSDDRAVGATDAGSLGLDTRGAAPPGRRRRPATELGESGYQCDHDQRGCEQRHQRSAHRAGGAPWLRPHLV